VTEIVVGDARVVLGDCRDVLRTLADNSVDSVVTDPPYEIGFMGRSWDGTGVAYDVTVWAECLRVLKPGGHILAFGGSRTWHRLAVAVEDAGFEIRDSIAWIYGSGFPKSLNVSKAIDKSDAKVERRARDLRFTAWMRGCGITAKTINQLTSSNMGAHYLTDKEQPTVPTEEMFTLLRPHLPAVPDDIERLVFDRTVESKNFAEREVIGQQKNAMVGWSMDGTTKFVDRDITAPSTSEAKQWSGWGTALKPAFEPVVVGRKPFGKGVTVAENVLAWGVGGLNIDASRIGTNPGYKYRADKNGTTFHGKQGERIERTAEKAGKDFLESSQGRWPANVILDEVTAGLVDEQSGQVKGQVGMSKTKGDFRFIEGDTETVQKFDQGKTDSGGASRFFYQAKASKRDRNEGLEGLQDSRGGSERMNNSDGRKAEIGESDRLPVTKNHHPTVKPTQLMRYLIKLVTPPGGTVLDPFTGSGSTGKAALLDGYKFVGAELTEEYLPIIEGRLRWALEQDADDETLF
jgi:DNA modification methylase